MKVVFSRWLWYISKECMIASRSSKGLDDFGYVYVYYEFNLVNIHAAFWPGRL